MKKEQHVTKNQDGNWKVLGSGNKRATSIHKTQREAIEAATKIAKNQHTEVVIHGKDGLIRDKNSYGDDPNPPKG